MDYGIQNSHHLYAAPQTLLHPPPQPQPQPSQAAATHLYSSYYSNANPNPYPSQIVKHEDPSPSALVFTDGGVVQAAEHYAFESGFDGQSVSYGAYQPYEHTSPYIFAPPVAASSYHQAKRFKMQSNILDLDAKKKKVIEGGAAANAVRACTICNVVCNSDKVFASHLAGDKHTLKALGRNAYTMAPKVVAHMKQMCYAKKSNPQAYKRTDAFGVSGAPKIVQTFVCEVCKIECNSQENLNSHKVGKKHRGNLQKLQEKIAPKPSAPSTDKNISAGHDETTKVEAVKKTPSSLKEGLLTKKDNVLKGGAAEEAILECAICGVVCNSKTVYDFHVAGKKHLAMIKKQDVGV